MGEAPRQRVDRQLGSESRQDDGARDGCLGIGVLQPVVHEREGGLDAEGDEDQHARRRLQIEAVEGDGPGLTVMDHRASQQQHA